MILSKKKQINLFLILTLIIILSCKRDYLKSKITFVKEVNLKNVNVGDTINTRIYIKNISNIEYEIFDIKTSCGCTLADLSEKCIKPGDSILLKSTFIAKEEDVGLINQSIVIKGNTEPEFSIIKIKGEVK